MSFAVLPALDVAGGRAVSPDHGGGRLGGDLGDPFAIARRWQAAGASWIHLVDLDLAFGRGSNADLLAEVIGELDVAVELAGGVADDASLERALASGCARVNLSSAALADPAWCERAIATHGDRLAMSLDVRVDHGADGSVRHRVVARGRPDLGDLGEPADVLDRLDRAGCARYVVTDVSRDGSLLGPNVELYRAVGEATPAPMLASGGVSSLADLATLADLAATGGGLEGAVVGHALHAGRFTLPEALATVRRDGRASR